MLALLSNSTLSEDEHPLLSRAETSWHHHLTAPHLLKVPQPQRCHTRAQTPSPQNMRWHATATLRQVVLVVQPSFQPLKLLSYPFNPMSLPLPKDAPCLPLALSHGNIILTTSNCMRINGNHLCEALHMMLCARLSLYGSDDCVPYRNELWREKDSLPVDPEQLRNDRPDHAGLGEPATIKQ